MTELSYFDKERLNRLIAETVFNWTERPCIYSGLDEAGVTRYEDGYAACSCCGSFMYFDIFQHTTIPPELFSTNMGAAIRALNHACLGGPQRLTDRTILLKELFVLPEPQETLDAQYALGIICSWTPEKICLAILTAYGKPFERTV